MQASILQEIHAAVTGTTWGKAKPSNISGSDSTGQAILERQRSGAVHVPVVQQGRVLHNIGEGHRVTYRQVTPRR